MPDVFIIVVKCPICKEKAMFEFETNALGGLGKEYEVGEDVRSKEIEIFIGEIKKAVASCPKCNNTIAGDIEIKEWKFNGINRLREHQWKKVVYA